MPNAWNNILVFGKAGQLATALREVLPSSTTFLGQKDTDFCSSTEVLQTLNDLQPDLVINTAAYTQVDLAQTHVDECSKINATAVGLIANWCASHKCFLIHISTDYVFDGRSTETYKEEDPTHPLNVYGSSKLLGEHLIQKAGGPHLILRTSWLFHESGQNFIKTILNFGREKDELKIVDDQISSPTYAGDLARGIATLIAKSELPSGLFHVANRGYCSRLELMEYVFKMVAPWDSKLKARLSPGKTADFPTPALRPLVTKLDCSKAQTELGLSLPPWQEGVAESLRKLYKR